MRRDNPTGRFEYPCSSLTAQFIYNGANLGLLHLERFMHKRSWLSLLLLYNRREWTVRPNGGNYLVKGELKLTP